MQEYQKLYQLNVNLGDTRIRSEHRYTWEQVEEINDLVQTSAQRAIDCDAIAPLPMRRRDPGDEDYEVVKPASSTIHQRKVTKWVFEFNSTDTRILQIAAATAIVSAGIGIGAAAVAGMVGLVWG